MRQKICFRRGHAFASDVFVKIFTPFFELREKVSICVFGMVTVGAFYLLSLEYDLSLEADLEADRLGDLRPPRSPRPPSRLPALSLYRGERLRLLKRRMHVQTELLTKQTWCKQKSVFNHTHSPSASTIPVSTSSESPVSAAVTPTSETTPPVVTSAVTAAIATAATTASLVAGPTGGHFNLISS